MKTNRLIALLLLTLSTLNPQLCFAQGTAFTYQGRLNDGANPAGGIYDLRFTIYDAAGGGNVVSGPLTNSALAVSNGLFSATLDFGVGVFTGANRWLEIAARTNAVGAFTTLNPRQPLTSTPYAIQSANAQNAAVAAMASSVNAGNVSGVLTMAQLPPGVVTNGASGVNFTGTFTGNGGGLSNLWLGSVMTSRVVAWGANGNGQLDVPPSTQNGVIALTGGSGHSLALKTNGSVVAWGQNNFGQTTVPVAAQSGVVAISSRLLHNLALKNDGTVVAWGYNFYGQTNVPLAAQNGAAAVAAGTFHSVVLKTNGTIIAWGWNVYGQTNVPVAAQSGVVAIAADDFNSMALKTNGSVIVWGGHPAYPTQTNVPVEAQSGVIAIATGEGHCLALKTNGSVIAWGRNNDGEANVPIAAQDGVIRIAACYRHSLALKSDGTLLVWGRNNEGQGTVPPTAQSGVMVFGAGQFHNLALISPPLVGNGSGLTALNAANLTGTIPLALLPSGLVTNGASGVNLNGTFAGNGAGVTNLSLYSVNSFGAINPTVQSNAFVLASLPAAGSGPIQVVTSDVDGDGRLDLIVGSALTNNAIVLTNSGGGIFGSNATYTVGLGYFPVVVADVNGDGKPDLIGADYQSNLLTVLTNNGSGRFGTKAIYTMAGATISVAAADLNMDGKVDLIYSDLTLGALIVMTNNGTGSFGSNATYSLSGLTAGVAAADFNGDGKPDVICANVTNNVLSVLTNNGAGGLTLAQSVASTDPLFLYVADFNGDGRPDVISRENDVFTGAASVLTNNGSGGFGLAGFVPGDPAMTYTPADLNGDGKLDLICPNFTTNTLSLLTNNGSAGFAEFSKVVVGNQPNGAAAADINGDGSLDLISANTAADTVSILTNGNVLTINFTGDNFSGNNFTGGRFSGNGSGLTNLSASHLTSGTLPSSALGGTYTNALDFNNPNNSFTGSSFFGGIFSGEGSGLTGLNASFITGGTVPDERLSANVSLLGPTIESSEIANGTIVDADINITAAIVDTKLATITTSGKVANSALSASVSLIGQTVESAEITDGTIANADISPSANIADTKLGTIAAAGKVADSALSGNVAFRSGGNTFTNNQTIRGALYLLGDASGGGSSTRSANPGWASLAEFTDFTGSEFRSFVGMDGVGVNGGSFTNQMYIGTYTPHPVKFYVGNSEKMVINTSGNVGIGINPTNKLHVAGGVSATAFVNTSDRNAKENFEPVSPREVLNKVAALPITTWNFKTMNDGRHMGPMAQDFYAAFGLGGGNTTITSTDPDGVALAAIQGLNEKLEARSQKLEAENAGLKSRLEKLERLMNDQQNGGRK